MKKERAKEKDFAKGTCYFDDVDGDNPTMRIALDDGKGKPNKMKKNGKKLLKKLGLAVEIFKGELGLEDETLEQEELAEIEEQVDEENDDQKMKKIIKAYKKAFAMVAANVIPALKAKEGITEQHYQFLYKNSLLIFFLISSLILSCGNPTVNNKDDSSTVDSTEKEIIVKSDTVWKDGKIDKLSIAKLSEHIDTTETLEKDYFFNAGDGKLYTSLKYSLKCDSHDYSQKNKSNSIEIYFDIPKESIDTLLVFFDFNKLIEYPIFSYKKWSYSSKGIEVDSIQKKKVEYKSATFSTNMGSEHSTRSFYQKEIKEYIELEFETNILSKFSDTTDSEGVMIKTLNDSLFVVETRIKYFSGNKSKDQFVLNELKDLKIHKAKLLIMQYQKLKSFKIN